LKKKIVEGKEDTFDANYSGNLREKTPSKFDRSIEPDAYGTSPDVILLWFGR
jgi:hypothetical protein